MKTIYPVFSVILNVLSMLAFAGNSLLCRIALQYTETNAINFTSIRLVSGALMLWLIVRLRGGRIGRAGSWGSALALFAYAASFSIAYISLPTATGALLLFGAVQLTMISYGLWTGERFQKWQILGLFIALTGLVVLLLPGLSTPPLQGSILMVGAGFAWGIYSLLGQGVDNPIRVTGGNFLRTIPFTITLLITHSGHSYDNAGVVYAILSGAITSAWGYAIWYTALPQLQANQSAIIQLSVPVLAAIGAIIFLNEPMTLRLGLSSVAVLGGIALVISQK